VPPLANWKICIYAPSRHPLFFFQPARFFLPVHGSSAQGASSTHGAQIFQLFSPWRRSQTRRPCSFFLAHAASPSSALPSRRKVQAPLLPPLTGVQQQLRTLLPWRLLPFLKPAPGFYSSRHQPWRSTTLSFPSLSLFWNAGSSMPLCAAPLSARPAVASGLTHLAMVLLAEDPLQGAIVASPGSCSPASSCCSWRLFPACSLSP
jgi:hypothetical protein